MGILPAGCPRCEASNAALYRDGEDLVCRTCGWRGTGLREAAPAPRERPAGAFHCSVCRSNFANAGGLAAHQKALHGDGPRVNNFSSLRILTKTETKEEATMPELIQTPPAAPPEAASGSRCAEPGCAFVAKGHNSLGIHMGKAHNKTLNGAAAGGAAPSGAVAPETPAPPEAPAAVKRDHKPAPNNTADYWRGRHDGLLEGFQLAGLAGGGRP